MAEADVAPSIDVRSLTRRFGTLVAVDPLSFSVGPGKIFGLLGSNGAGKSTLVKMMTTLLPPTEGDALVAGASIVEDPSVVRSRIGYVPQMLSADGMLTGRENLMFSARLYDVTSSERIPRVDEALHFMGLDDAADKRVKTYPGGMTRRLELAQAMLHRPAGRPVPRRADDRPGSAGSPRRLGSPANHAARLRHDRAADNP